MTCRSETKGVSESDPSLFDKSVEVNVGDFVVEIENRVSLYHFYR